MQPLISRLLSARFYHRPVILVGAGRSGTIALYKALGRHRRVLAMPSENPFLTSLAAAAALFSSDAEADYYRASVRLSPTQLHQRLRLLCFETSAGGAGGLRTLLRALWARGGRYPQVTHWCVKSFPLQRQAQALLEMYPEARFVYLVRNGLDVVHSRTRFPAFRDQPFERHCEVWAHAAERFAYLEHLPQAVWLRHEDLLADPARVFQRIEAHLGLEPDPAPAQFAANNVVHSLGNTATESGRNPMQAIAGREPGYLGWSAEQRERFRTVCGAGMRRLGYAVPF